MTGGKRIIRHKAGIYREQISLEPLCFDALISEDNPVRAIEAIVNRFDMIELDFTYSETKKTGQKPYNPADMLRLYLYGYFNGVRSSRKLEGECSRNVELMWLIGCLKPDFKTIADFRKNNQIPIQKVFLKFSIIRDELDWIQNKLDKLETAAPTVEENDVYIYPEGKTLPRKQKRRDSKVVPEYGSKHVCADCPVKDQ